jgi:hypothetical protein
MDEKVRAEDTPQDTPEDPAPAETAENPKKPPERRIWKWLRVSAYIVCVCLAAAALAMQYMYRNMQNSALEIGDELDKLGDIGEKQPIILNGQRIYVASSVHELSVEETLDRAETLCKQGHPGQFNQPPDQLLDSASTTLERGGNPSRAMVRQERDNRGVVLCFAPPEGRVHDDSVRTKIKSFMGFMASGDLEAIGHLRYMYAKKTDSGRTHLIRVWTDGPFNLYAMARNGDKDAPGTDPDDAPRPPDSVRLLSATVDVAPYAVRVYETRRTPTEISAAYDKEMPELGWKRLVADGDTRVYQRNDVTVFVTPSVQKEGVLVSMLHMGSE